MKPTLGQQSRQSRPGSSTCAVQSMHCGGSKASTPERQKRFQLRLTICKAKPSDMDTRV